MRSLSREMRSSAKLFGAPAAEGRRAWAGYAKICDFMEYGLHLLAMASLSDAPRVVEFGRFQGRGREPRPCHYRHMAPRECHACSLFAREKLEQEAAPQPYHNSPKFTRLHSTLPVTPAN